MSSDTQALVKSEEALWKETTDCFYYCRSCTKAALAYVKRGVAPSDMILYAERGYFELYNVNEIKPSD